MAAELKHSRAFELVVGAENSWRRYFSAFVLAFWAATVVRQFCFTSAVFGKHLSAQLAPIERDEVQWAQSASSSLWSRF